MPEGYTMTLLYLTAAALAATSVVLVYVIVCIVARRWPDPSFVQAWLVTCALPFLLFFLGGECLDSLVLGVRSGSFGVVGPFVDGYRLVIER